MRLSGGTALTILSPAKLWDYSSIALTAAGGLVLLYFSQPLALGLALGLAAVIYFSNRIQHLLYFLVIYLPLEEFILKWVDYSIYPALRYGIELVIYATLFKVVLEKLARNQKIVSSPIDIPLLLLAVLGLISTFLNGLPILAGVLGLRPLLRYAALFYLILNSNLSKESLPRFFRTILIIATLEVGIGLTQYFIGEPANLFLRPKDSLIADRLVNALSTSQDLFAGQKIFATLGRYNLLGSFLACILLLLLAFRMEKGSFSLNQKLLLAGVLPVFLLTYSRLSWVGFLAGFFTLLLIKKKSKIILALGLVAFALMMTFSSGTTSLYQSEVRGSLRDRILGPFTADYWHVTTSTQRVFAASQLLSNISGSNLVVGFGPGSVGSLVTNLDEGVSQLHRIGDPKKLLIVGDVGWAALLGQVGVVGTCLFVWLLVRLFRASLRNYRSSREFWIRSFSLAVCCYLVALVAMNCFSLAFESRVNSAYLWIICGLAVRFSENA